MAHSGWRVLRERNVVSLHEPIVGHNFQFGNWRLALKLPVRGRKGEMSSAFSLLKPHSAPDPLGKASGGFCASLQRSFFTAVRSSKTFLTIGR